MSNVNVTPTCEFNTRNCTQRPYGCCKPDFVFRHLSTQTGQEILKTTLMMSRSNTLLVRNDRHGSSSKKNFIGRLTIHAIEKMKPHQYAVSPLKSWCKNAGVWEMNTLKNVCISKLNATIRHTCRNCRARISRARLKDISLKSEVLFFIRCGDSIAKTFALSSYN